MPFEISQTQGTTTYQEPFIGRLDHTLHVKVDVSTLTTKEVDSKGKIRPGVPLTRAGALAVATGLSTVAAAVASGGNTGNGTVGSLLGKAGKPSEVITLRARSSTVFNVVGSVSGRLADATVGTPYVSAVINFLITAGGTAFVAGDEFQLVITGATPDAIFGVVPEAAALVSVVNGAPTDQTLAADTSDPFVAVGVIGIVDRDAVEANLGRTLTAAEVAAFAAGGCKLVLSR